jgi:hypothetical protein
LLRFLYRAPNCPKLIDLGVIACFARYSNRLGDFHVNEVAMTAFAAAIDEAGAFSDF